jgi:Ala-tRNA(Pro) deacylase
MRRAPTDPTCAEGDTPVPLTSDELLERLEAMGIEAKTHRHPPLFTVEESQALRGEIAGAHTKNLFVKDKKDAYFLLVVGEEAQVDLKQVHKLIGASSRVSFGKPEALMELLGVEPGSVTAFGIVNDTDKRVRIVFDEDLVAQEIINAHPLVNTATTSIASADLLRFVRQSGHEPVVLKLSA